MYSDSLQQVNRTATARQVEMIVRRLECLSTLPQTAGGALHLISEIPLNTAGLSKIIESDPALTSRIFAAAELDGEGRQVEQIISSMSAEKLRNAVLSVRVLPNEDCSNGQEQFKWRIQMLLHCLGTAFTARKLAELILAKELQPFAFSAGLLHDLGKLALLEIMPKSVLRMTEKARIEGTSLTLVEQENLGLDHTALGRRLAEKWGFPSPVTSAIWLHHSDWQSLKEHVPHAELVRIVQLADLLSRRADSGHSGNYEKIDDPAALAQSLDISAEQVSEISDQLVEFIQSKSRSLGPEASVSAHNYYKAVQKTAFDLARDNIGLSETSRQFGRQTLQMELLNRFLSTLLPSENAELISFHLASALQKTTGGGVSIILPTEPGDLSVCCYTLDRNGQTHSGLYQLSRKNAAHFFAQKKFAVTEIDSSLDWLFDKLEGKLNPAFCWTAPLEIPGTHVGQAVFEIAESDRAGELCGAVEPLFKTAASLLHAAAIAEQHRSLSERFVEVMGNLRQVRRQLAEGEVLEGIAEMAAGAAHELNNPLSVISGRAQMLLESSGDPGQKEMLIQIRDRTSEMSDILNELMNYARPRKPEKLTVKISELARSAADRACRIHQADSESVQIIGLDDLADAYVDSSQVIEALAHVVLNALQSYTGKGQVRIEKAAMQPPDFSAIAVIDRGCGMDEKTIANAARPFFSAPPAGRRRGMGLALAQRLLRHNGASLSITSQPGKGTAVTINLPCA